MAYSKKTWVDSELITKDALNNMENGISANDIAIVALNGKTSNATKSKAGIVKQCALVAEASGENVTKAEFKALLDALKTANIMANS